MDPSEENDAIERLMEEAREASDNMQVFLCKIALGVLPSVFTTRNQAREHCLKVIADAEAEAKE